MDWSADGWRSAFRIELRVQAIGLASRGWPVLTGTFPTEDGWSDGEKSVVDGPSPVRRDVRESLNTAPEQVASWWSGHPYSLLLATGDAVEALEVSASTGRRAASALRATGTPVPIVASPHGRWYFLTAPGRPLHPDLAGSGLVREHGEGSWVPMPPTIFHHGVVHWRVKPEICGWRLPASQLVQDALHTSGCLDSTGSATGESDEVAELAAVHG